MLLCFYQIHCRSIGCDTFKRGNRSEKSKEGALFYFETKHRTKVKFTPELRATVKSAAGEMHEYFDRRYLPRPKRTKACNACSLKEYCMPKLEKLSAKKYNDMNLGKEETTDEKD